MDEIPVTEKRVSVIESAITGHGEALKKMTEILGPLAARVAVLEEQAAQARKLMEAAEKMFPGVFNQLRGTAKPRGWSWK